MPCGGVQGVSRLGAARIRAAFAEIRDEAVTGKIITA